MSDETTTVECSEMKLLELAVQDLPPDPLKHLLIHHHDFATTIAETVKGNYHEISGFTLEVSLPTLITENEQLILSYMRNKYASEAWFQEKFSSEHISVKDALKLSMTLALEKLLGVKASASDFRIRLTYEHVDAISAENRTGRNQSNKRIKSGTEVSSHRTSEGFGLVKCTNGTKQTDDVSNSNSVLRKVSSYRTSEGFGLVKCTNGTKQTDDVSNSNSVLRKVGQPCHMTLVCSRAPIYIGGRYLK
nr:putative tRNA pseudouridine synthase Pus10 isoform X2 [Tanacetum cinerariifolium]